MASVWITVRRRKNGAKRYRVEFHLGGRGARSRYAGVFATRREANIRKQWVAGELAAQRIPDLRSLRAPAVAPTLRDAAERWQASRVDVEDSTQTVHRTALNRALPILGHLRVDRITAHDVAEMVAQLHAAGKARGSIRKSVNYVAMALDYTGISPNPARDRVIVKLPRDDSEDINPPSAADVEAVYWTVPSKHRLPILFLDLSGLRVSAIDRLLVGDYDERNARVLARKSITKNKKPVWVDLPPAIDEAIRGTLPPREDRDTNARLFAYSGADAIRTAIARACAALGIPLWSPHDLRHRRISLLHAQGVPWAKIGEQVGQRDLATTANTYTHVLIDESELDYVSLLAGSA
jgi:integrase